jgi:hypothetical protein
MRKDQGIRDTRARDTEDNIERDDLGDGSFTMKRNYVFSESEGGARW